MEQKQKNCPVGIMDSGLGGLSVLREAIKEMPEENFIYLGDSKHAPYGVKTLTEVRKLTEEAVYFLLSQNVKEIIIACNTATSASVRMLREQYKDIPIIGMEPALKPAALHHKGGKVVVMATPMTLQEEKFHHLLHDYENIAEIHGLPCGELVTFIEQGMLETEKVEEYLKEKLQPYIKQGLDAIVLGCTHFPFAKAAITKVVGEQVEIVDGSKGTVREAKRRLKEKDLLTDAYELGNVQIFNTSDKQEMIELSWELLKKNIL